MMTVILAAGSDVPRRVPSAERRAVIMDACPRNGRSLAERIRVHALRFALPLVAMAAIATAGNGALAATAPDSCDTASVVSHAFPAIVNITVVKVGSGSGEETTAADKPAEDKSAPERIEVFVGSGSVIDPSGIIVTNKHVIQGAALIRVIFHDKSEVAAQLIAAASLVDLALLKVNVPHPLPTLQFGNSDALQVGQPVIAVGNPLGLGTSVSTGVVSALNRDLMRTPFDDFIQTDATINPGNSGGPLLDCTGKMIGVDTALYSNSKVLGSIGLGFALPSNDAKFVSTKLRDPQGDSPNWIGLHLQDLTAQLATTFGRSDVGGAIVTGVDPGSPAARASFEPGDIVTGANGHTLPDARAVLRTIVQEPAGGSISLTFWRHGHAEEATLKGNPWPHMMALRSDVLASADAVARAQAEGLGLGIHLAAITPENRQQFALGDVSGVLVDQVTPGSQAEDLGLKPGDVIEQVGDLPTKVPADVTSQLTRGDAASGDLVALLVRNKTKAWWVALYVGHVDVTDLVTSPGELPYQSTSSRNAAAAQRP
jgi:serine protease Do